MQIYYINLERRIDRNQSMINKLHNLNYTRFNAYDGSTLVVTDTIKHLFRNNDFNYKRGVIGAALSHMNLWKQVLETDSDYVLILEDDVNLVDNFKELLTNIESILDSNQIKLLLLGYTGNLNIPIVNTGQVTVQKVIDKTGLIGGLFSYIIHKSVISFVLNKINETGIYRAIDMYLFDNIPCDIFVLNPQIVRSDCVTISNNIDSDIHYNLCSIFDEYDYYPEMDSEGDNITQVTTFKTFDELKEIAEKTKGCVGFNTFGYLKSKINMMNSINYGKFHGLYVRKYV